MENQAHNETIRQLIYFSKAVIKFDEKKLLELMEKSRKSNNENGITGILLYGDSVFVQCIEGGETELETLYEKIKADPRHDEVNTLFENSASTRSFSEWLMGCAEITDEEALNLSTARWEQIKEDSSENQEEGFALMKTLWQMKKHKNLTRKTESFNSYG